MPTDRITINVAEIHKVLISESDGQWISVVPGSFTFVYASLIDGDGDYISDSGMYVFTTPDGERFSIPSERLAGMQRHAEEVIPPGDPDGDPEEPPVDEPPIDPEDG